MILARRKTSKVNPRFFVRDCSRSVHESCRLSIDECGTASRESLRYEGSIRRHFIGIDFEQPKPAVGNVLGLVETISQLDGSYKEIAAGHKGKVSPRRRFECATDDGAIIAAGNRRCDIQLVAGSIEEFDSDLGMGSGPSIL